MCKKLTRLCAVWTGRNEKGPWKHPVHTEHDPPRDCCAGKAIHWEELVSGVVGLKSSSGDRPTRRIESLLLLLLLLLLHVLLNNLLNVVELEISFPSSTCPAPSPTGSTHHSLRFFQFYPQSFLHTHHFRTITPAPPISHLILFSSLQSVFLWSTNKKSIFTPSFQSSPPAIANSLSCSTPNSLQIWSNLAPDLAVSASPSLFRSLLRWLFNCVLGAHRSVSSGLRGLARSGQFVVNLREFW